MGGSALVGLRVPPGVDAAEAPKLLQAHLEAHTPWGARVQTDQIGQGQAFRADTSSPAYTAMAQAMSDAYDGAEMRYAGQRDSSRCATPSRPSTRRRRSC